MYRRRLSQHHSHLRDRLVSLPLRSSLVPFHNSSVLLDRACTFHGNFFSARFYPSSPIVPLSTSPPPFFFPRRFLFGFSSPNPVTQTIRRRVPFSPQSFFSVVVDVSSYHLFLPFCVSSTVSSPSSPPPSPFKAQLTVGFRVFTESYTSLVTYSSPSPLSIQVQAIESSIFDHLNSSWRFFPVQGNSEECEVEFTIDFLVSSRMHAGAVQMFFGDVTEQQMKAFIKRCSQLQREQKRQEITQEVNQPLATAVTKMAAIDGLPPSPSSIPIPATPEGVKQPPPPAGVSKRPSAAPSPPRPVSVHDYSPPVHFSQREIDQLRSLFREYSSGGGSNAGIISGDAGKTSTEPAPTLSQITDEQTQQPLSSSSPSSFPSSTSHYPYLSNGKYINEYPSSSSSSSSSPLLLSFPAFCRLCAHLASPSAGVFTKYRERASLRACAEEESIALACFASQPSLYKYSGSGMEGEDVSPIFSHSHPLSKHLSASTPLSGSVWGGGANRSSALARPGLSFGEFLEVTWGLARASNVERLHTSLMRAASKEVAKEAMSVGRLQVETMAFFALQLGIIRQVMPAMVVRRSKDMEKEMGIQRDETQSASSSSSSSLSDSSGRGLYLLAMVGLMESVLTETEKAIGEAMTVLLHQVQARGRGRAPLPVKEWTDWWDRQAELLAVLTVPGQSSLIQWASATQTAEAFARSHEKEAKVGNG